MHVLLTAVFGLHQLLTVGWAVGKRLWELLNLASFHQPCSLVRPFVHFVAQHKRFAY
jgi:hypothetical protein